MGRSRTTWSSSRLAALAAALLLAISATDALAQAAPASAPEQASKPAEPSPSDVETAKAQFVEGLALRDKGDVPGALQRFRAAYALVPTPITALELGKTLIASGKILEGREILLEASHMPKKPDESPKAQEARDQAAQAADAAKAKLAALSIDTDFGAQPAITIDDQPVPKEAARAPRILDPGHHVVVVRASGRVGRAEVDLREGEQRQLHLEAEQAEQGNPPPPPPPPRRGKLQPNALVYVGGVGAGVGLVAGIATGIAAMATANTVKRECPNGQCPQPYHGDLDASLALGWTSTIAFAAAGVFAVVGVVGLLTSHHAIVAPQQGRLRLDVGAGTLLLTGTF